jgi:hypothetical protein
VLLFYGGFGLKINSHFVCRVILVTAHHNCLAVAYRYDFRTSVRFAKVFMTEGRIKRRLDSEEICHVKASFDFRGKGQV